MKPANADTIWKVQKNNILIDYSNETVTKEINRNRHAKVVILYGANHYEGIKNQLLKKGFSTQ